MGGREPHQKKEKVTHKKPPPEKTFTPRREGTFTDQKGNYYAAVRRKRQKKGGLGKGEKE